MMRPTYRSATQTVYVEDRQPDGNPRGRYRITRSAGTDDNAEDLTALLADEKWTVYHDEFGGGSHSVGFVDSYKTTADAMAAIYEHDKKMTFPVSEFVIPECER